MILLVEIFVDKQVSLSYAPFSCVADQHSWNMEHVFTICTVKIVFFDYDDLLKVIVC